MHVTRELVEALREDTIPQTLGELLLSHHLALTCEGCQTGLLALRQRAGERWTQRLIDLWLGGSSKVIAPRRDLETLLHLPSHEERLHRVGIARTRFRSPWIVVHLLAEARSCVAGNPWAALELAELATAVARRIPKPRSCLALALAHTGNALRAAGELTEARPYFDQADDILHSGRPEPHPWLAAEVASLEGSLLKDRRRLESACDCLLYARDHFAAADDPVGRARVEVKLAAVHRLAGDVDSAIDLLHHALEGLRGLTSPKLLVCALHNLVLYRTEAGDLDSAERVLQHLTPVYDWFPEIRERHLWLHGTVARAREETDEAEHAFRQALDLFLAKGAPTHSALVALDLAELLILAGRGAEVPAVTRPLPALFQAQDVHREATAAVVLFHRAASEHEITRQLLAQLRSFLEGTRTDRTLRQILSSGDS